VLARRRRLAGRVALLAALAVLAGCTGAEESGRPSGPSRSPSVSPSPSAAPASPTPTRTVPPPDPVSVPALFTARYDGRGLALRRTLATTDAYTSYSVTYRSNGLRISGKLDVPRGRGPFPAVVLAHGYIDPAVYVNGQGMRREQDWLARAGYVVLHTDYRNHAFSAEDPTAERRLRLGYTTDVVNAVHALRRTTEVAVDDDRVGLVGRSMGGGVVYNVLVARPGLVDAAVVFAPVSSRTADNFDRWIRDDPGRSALSDLLLRRHGEPRENPRFWRQVSPRPYFDRITEPVLIHHGAVDATCPLRWSRATLRAMRRAGVDVRLRVYPGEDHAFVALWPQSMRRTTAFLRANL
jgi:dipeptidyl aminopeptidase/acylaminoacyl peptidase